METRENVHAGPAAGQRAIRSRISGIGQLTLVEHALCPLDPKASLVEHLVHNTSFFYTDQNRHRRCGKVRVTCPAGLSANDEFYLWGLLALTFSQPEPDAELHATPHFCLRKLGVIDQHARRGGRQYRQFADAVERLSLVKYRNDSFYDPIRAEHRKVSFGFLSYSLPLDPDSSRAWRIAWDPIFFELLAPAGGQFRFDLETYGQLDAASRRLFLFLSKVFQRRETTPVLDLRNLAVNVLGFSPTMGTRDIKIKVGRAIARLAELHVVTVPKQEALWRKTGCGAYSIQLLRGSYFTRRDKAVTPGLTLDDSALAEQLRAIGFHDPEIARLLKQYRVPTLREWADITLAARERFGTGFFKKSPQAYFIDNVRNVVQGTRTPPDWWHELRKAEVRIRPSAGRDRPQRKPLPGLSAEARQVYDKVTEQMFKHFRSAGQPEDLARANAERFARERLRQLERSAEKAPKRVGDLLQ